MPAFAVDRTQELLYVLRELEDAGRIPTLPVFIDSPMAIDVTEIYARHPEDHDLDMRRLSRRRRLAALDAPPRAAAHAGAVEVAERSAWPG